MYHIQVHAITNQDIPGRTVQSVTCLTADPVGCKFDPGPDPYFVEIDHEMISMAVLLPSADSRRVVVSYKRKNVQEVLINRLVKLAQE